jgi:hypothetical protein
LSLLQQYSGGERFKLSLLQQYSGGERFKLSLLQQYSGGEQFLTVLKILNTLAGGPLNIEALGFSLSSL